MKFSNGTEVIEFEEEEKVVVEKTIREGVDPDNKLTDLQGSFIDKVDVDEDGNIWIHFGGDIISINYSCYGGVFVNDETDRSRYND
jgi:hypothetical protein